jgi:hypothetical protein
VTVDLGESVSISKRIGESKGSSVGVSNDGSGVRISSVVSGGGSVVDGGGVDGVSGL